MSIDQKKMSSLEESLLIVEDDVSLRQFIIDYASSLGFRYKAAVSGTEALEILSTNKKFFLILSDYKMPGLNGLELCGEVRKISMDLPFVLISGLVDKSVALSGLNAGVTGVIEKPLRLDVLQNCLLKYAQERIKKIEDEKRESEEIIELFAEEAKSLLEDLEHYILKLEEANIDRATIDLLFRNVHSVKGGASAVPGCQYLAQVTHAFESCLSLIKNNEFHPAAQDIELFLFTSDLCNQLIHLVKERKDPEAELKVKIDFCLKALLQLKERESKSDDEKESLDKKGRQTDLINSTTSDLTAGSQVISINAGASASSNADADGILVSNDKLESFMKLSGEMIVLKNYFKVLSQDPEFRSLSTRVLSKITDFSYSLNKITDHLQDKIMSVRKVSLDRALSKLPRIFRQVTNELNKKVHLTTEGFELGVDKTIANVLSACMTHMLRNAIDHGIESPEIRVERNKPPQGTIKIQAKEEKGMIFVTIADDGGGINKEKVLNKAIDKGVLDETKRNVITEDEIYDLLFQPGFSTAEKVTEISGRGVGMDVVKSEITEIGGKIKIQSELGVGTTFNIEIPIPKTVLVEQTVLVKAGLIYLAVPLPSIAFLSSVSNLEVSLVGRQRTIQFQNKTIILRTFQELVSGRIDDSKTTSFNDYSVVVLQHKTRYVGLLVNGIHDQLEAVIRPFDKISNNFPGFKGTTVLGDDSIAYVVDPDELVSLGLDSDANSDSDSVQCG